MNESLSIVIPTYNERESLAELVASLKDVLKSQKAWEVLFVDDGSTDDSIELLTEIVKSESNFKFILYLFKLFF